MSANKLYCAIGEEATRGTAESSTVGFIPLTSSAFPSYEPSDERRGEFRGEESSLGDIAMRRLSQKWSWPMEFNFFTEAGSTAGMVGTLLKHFFGKATSAQNGSTGQYYHMLYPVYNPYDASNLGTKALTNNMNASEGDTVKNNAWEGGRISSLTFTQEVGQLLKVSAQFMGQKKVASGTAIATPTFPAENLRCDYADLTCYYGTITRTGTAPNYTDFLFGSATSFCPDNYTLTIENGLTDNLQLCGADYPTKSNYGKFKATLSFKIDYTDPASGFSSVDELNAWYAANSQTNFFFHYDTGTTAGTGDNHQLYIDLPVMQRMGGSPEFSLETDPSITLNYEADFDTATTEYLVGIMLKNTASAV